MKKKTYIRLKVTISLLLSMLVLHPKIIHAQIYPNVYTGTGLNVKFIPHKNSYLDINTNTIYVNKWDEYEIAFQLPDDYEHEIKDFFRHYYDNIANNEDPKFEINPYADDSINVQIDLISPSGQERRKWAFFMRESKWGNDIDANIPNSAFLEENTSSELQNYNWHFRFMPDESDNLHPWTFTIRLNAANGSLPDYIFSTFTFVCLDKSDDNHGPLKVSSTDSKFLEFYDNTPFIAIGNNLADTRKDYYTQNKNLNFFQYHKYDELDYFNAISDMSKFGANSTRILMYNSNFAAEFDNLGVYDQYEHEIDFCTNNPIKYQGNRQWQLQSLDTIIELSREKNIYITLGIAPYAPTGAYENYIWGNHALLNQFCDYQNGKTSTFYPSKFFCDVHNPDIHDSKNALYFWRRLYKYLISRYGYSVNVPIIETFNEIELMLGYVDRGFESKCPAHNYTNFPRDPDTKDAIEIWHDKIIEYIRSSPYSYGLGEEYKLLSASYTIGGTYTSGNVYCSSIDLPSYYSLYNDNNPNYSRHNYQHLNITDLHSYIGWIGDPGQNINQYRFDYSGGDLEKSNSIIDNFTNNFHRPFRCGESGNFQSLHLSGGDEDVYKIYNNMTLSLHNDIWPSRFSGACSTPMSWFWETILRWPDTYHPSNTTINKLRPLGAPASWNLPKNIDDQIDYYGIGGSIINSDRLHTYTHQYSKFDQFMRANPITEEVTNGGFIDDLQGIEYYYEKATRNDKVVGWVHNWNSYWLNDYYATNKTYGGQVRYNFTGCNKPSLSVGMHIPGLAPYMRYSITYYYTWEGTPPPNFPTTYNVFADMDGDLFVMDGLSYLDCDTINQDMAFVIVPNSGGPSPLKVSSNTENEFDQIASIYPQPADKYSYLSFKNPFKICHLAITNSIGRTVFEKTYFDSNQVDIVTEDFPAGIYIVKLKVDDKLIYKKILTVH